MQLAGGRTLLGDAWRRFRRHRPALLGSLVFTGLLLLVFCGPLLYTRDPQALDFSVPTMAGPSLQHPFGTDDLGRDMLARVLAGGRISLAVGISAMLVMLLLGASIGLLAGYSGGLLDSLLMRLTDLFLSLPQIPLLLLVLYLFRETVQGLLGQEAGIFLLLVLMIGGLGWMPVARIMRANVLSLRRAAFVEAAHSLGLPHRRILLRHILPNTFSPLIVAATLGTGSAIISESVLSFLGLGFPPDTPTWGRLVVDGQNFLAVAPHMPLFPGAMIFLSVLSINFIGDGLRDALDPQHGG